MTYAGPLPISEAPDRPPLVLVVEDDPNLREVVCVVLEDEGFQVESASDGQQALELVSQHYPDAIVLDMGLPRLSGEEVVAALRELFGRLPPIVVMSAAGTIAQRAQRVGAATFIAKPFDLVELSAAVRKALAIA